MPESSIARDRLEEQIVWYDANSASNKRLFTWFRTATITLSVSIRCRQRS
jgi:hypothetical protein